MEATQLLDDTSLDSSEIVQDDSNDKGNCHKKLIGVLLFNEIQKEFNVFQGDIISLGRDPENCQIAIENKSLSRVHAVLEVDKKDTKEIYIYDNKSMNHTWRNNKKLKPHVRYQLDGGEKLKFGSLNAVFQINSTADDSNNSASNSTFLGSVKGEKIPFSEIDRNRDFVPETPANFYTKKSSSGMRNEISSFNESPSVDGTNEKTLLVLETQNSFLAEQAVTCQKTPSNNSPKKANQFSHDSTIESNITFDLPFDQVQNNDRESKLDDSSFLCPTQAHSSTPAVSNCNRLPTLKKMAIICVSEVENSVELHNKDIFEKDTQKIDSFSYKAPFKSFAKQNNSSCSEGLVKQQKTVNLLNAETQKLESINDINVTQPFPNHSPPPESIFEVETQKVTYEASLDVKKNSTEVLQCSDSEMALPDFKKNDIVNDIETTPNDGQGPIEETFTNLRPLNDKDAHDNGDDDIIQPTQFFLDYKPITEFTNKTYGNINSSNNESDVIDSKEKLLENVSEVSGIEFEDFESSNHVEDATSCSNKIIKEEDKDTSYDSENLLEEFDNESDSYFFGSEKGPEKEGIKSTPEEEFTEIYEDATQVIDVNDETVNIAPQNYLTTKASVEDEDIIMSSQDSAIGSNNKTNIALTSMIFTQGACSEQKKTDTQSNDTDMSIISQPDTNEKDAMTDDLTKLQDNDDNQKQITAFECADAVDELPVGPKQYLANESIVRLMPDIEEHCNSDSEPDSLDWLASTQELVKGLTEHDTSSNDLYNEKSYILPNANDAIENISRTAPKGSNTSALEECNHLTNIDEHFDQPSLTRRKILSTNVSTPLAPEEESIDNLVNKNGDELCHGEQRVLSKNENVLQESLTCAKNTQWQHAEIIEDVKDSNISLSPRKYRSVLQVQTLDDSELSILKGCDAAEGKTNDPSDVTPPKQRVSPSPNGNENMLQNISVDLSKRPKGLTIRQKDHLITSSSYNAGLADTMLDQESITTSKSEQNVVGVTVQIPIEPETNTVWSCNNIDSSKEYANVRHSKRISGKKGKSYNQNRNIAVEKRFTRKCYQDLVSTCAEIAAPETSGTSMPMRPRTRSAMKETKPATLKSERNGNVTSKIDDSGSTENSVPFRTRRATAHGKYNINAGISHTKHKRDQRSDSPRKKAILRLRNRIPEGKSTLIESAAKSEKQYRKRGHGDIADIKRTPKKRFEIRNTPSVTSEKTKSRISQNNAAEKSSPLRKRSISNSHPTVMFTGYDDPQHQRCMKDLGAKIAMSAKDKPTVCVTDKLRRTEKFMCALGSGIPIVSKDWVINCKRSKKILDPQSYILEDKEAEKMYGFSLKRSIEISGKTPLLKKCKLHATKSCLPPPVEIKEIVECAGGEWLKQMPKKTSDDTIVISCPEDKNVLNKAIKAGLSCHSKEFLLTGLLKQQLDYDSYTFATIL